MHRHNWNPRWYCTCGMSIGDAVNEMQENTQKIYDDVFTGLVQLQHALSVILTALQNRADYIEK